jgi:uncharacterized membrane protein YjjB (DUF3815 family)
MNVINILTALLWSGIAAAGFAILFQVPRRNLFYCALLGAIGYGVRVLLVNNGVALIISSLAGAVVVGFGGYWLSRYYQQPSPVFTVPGIIPLVPGSIAFQSMVTLIRALEVGPSGAESLFVTAAYDALTAGLIVFSLGVGISAPFLLMRRERPVV